MGFLRHSLAFLFFTVIALCAQAGDADWLHSVTDPAKPLAEDNPKVSVRLASEFDGLTPQAENRLAVIIDHEEGWHTYWKMPGDAGLETVFHFSKPRDLRVTEPRFPVPERLETNGLMSYGYSSRAVFPFEVKVPRFPEGLSATLGVHVDYVACKTVCVPGSADLSIRLPYRVAARRTDDAELIGNAAKSLPEITDADEITALYDAGNILITVPDDSVRVDRSLDFFPLENTSVEHTVLPVFTASDKGAELTLKRKSSGTPMPEHLHGVLVADGGPTEGGWAIETEIPLAKGDAGGGFFSGFSIPSLDTEGSAFGLNASTAVLFAFLGGLILNLMPCVLPILSLKLLELLKRKENTGDLFAHAGAFTAGILGTMTVLASVLIVLRSVGLSLGWGFQMQSPSVVTLLILLFVAIALNLAGLFEFTAASHLADSRLAKSLPRESLMSAFATGVLTVIVSSPCTAPFMGAALGYALTQPALTALFIFLALGLGMALPWVLLCAFPAWTRHIPKPGPWMTTFKKAMAAPMVLTIGWLFWVLAKQITLNGMLLVGMALGATTVFFWLLGREQWGRGKNRALMGVMTLAVLSIIVIIGTGIFDRNGSVAAKGDWERWSEDAVELSLARGKPVFVDFTAAWCMTCQANKIGALNREAVQERFRALDYTLLYGDWTNRDETITEKLEEFGRSGVPLYVIYRTDGTIEVLPPLLTTNTVLEALGTRP